MFGSKNQERVRDDWRTKPIEREHAGHLLPAPDTAVLAEEIVDRAGVLDANSSKTEKALRTGKVQGTIWGIVVDEGSERLQQVNAAAAAGMRVLAERDNFHSEMLFDYLSMHGAPGIVIHNKIVEYLTNEQFTTDFSEVLQEQHAAGELTLIGYLEEIALDIGGRDNEAATELLENWRRSLVAHAHENLGNAGLSDHYAELDAVVKRPDCSTEMVYNFLLNLGAGGRAIAEDWRSKLFDTFDPDVREELLVDDGHNAPPEDQVQPAEESNDTPPSQPPSQPEPVSAQVSMSEVHRTITEALDRIGISYHRSEQGDTYGFAHEGVVLMVAAREVEGNEPAAVLIQAVVLKKVECTKELTVDLLERNTRTMFAAWIIDGDSCITDSDERQPEGTVRVTLGYDLSAEQLDAGLVERMVSRVLGTAVSAADELQSAHGGERPAAITEEPVAEEPPSMPQGFVTFAGRYPGYEPAQAMVTFLSTSGQGSRPAYEERRDLWTFDGGGYVIGVGCFAEPDGTPVIVVTGLSHPEQATLLAELMMGEKSALETSAYSTENFLAEDWISEAVASGALRQLRPSEVGPPLDSVREGTAPAGSADPSLRFDGLYYAQGSSYQSYLRFYEDGTVLQVSTNGKPEQLARWFAKTHTEVPRGTYAIDGQSIEFSTVSSEGTVAYKGSVFDETVELSSHSYIDGHEDQATYSFVQVALH